MLLVSMSCLMTVVVLNLHFKGGHGKRVPLYLRRIFAVLAKMVFVKVREKELVEPTSPSPKEVSFFFLSVPFRTDYKVR